MRASEMRTLSRTPAFSSFFGIGNMPHSGMPGALQDFVHENGGAAIQFGKFAL